MTTIAREQIRVTMSVEGNPCRWVFEMPTRILRFSALEFRKEDKYWAVKLVNCWGYRRLTNPAKKTVKDLLNIEEVVAVFLARSEIQVEVVSIHDWEALRLRVVNIISDRFHIEYPEVVF